MSMQRNVVVLTVQIHLDEPFQGDARNQALVDHIMRRNRIGVRSLDLAIQKCVRSHTLDALPIDVPEPKLFIEVTT